MTRSEGERRTFVPDQSAELSPRDAEAIYGDQPHGIGGSTPAFVRQVTTNVLRAFADGPAADKYKATDNLAAMGERTGTPSTRATFSNQQINVNSTIPNGFG